MFIFLGLVFLVFFFISSAFWSVSEIALNHLSKYRIKKMIVSHKSIAIPLIKWLDSPYYMLTLILTGNVISDMMLSFLGASVAVAVFTMLNRHIVEFFTWIIITFLVLLIGEITPKIYGNANAQKVTVFAMPILAKIEYLTKPLLWPVYKTFDIIFRKNGNTSIRPTLSSDEIKSLIAEADKDGVFDKEISVMIERSVNFTETSASRIMTPFENIESVNLNENNEKFIDMIVETARTRVPVYDGVKTNIVGYIHINDVLQILKEKNENSIKDVIKPAYFISDDKKINELLKELQSGRTHIAFIKDSKNKILGMVALEDIVEEIVGEILDEYEL